MNVSAIILLGGSSLRTEGVTKQFYMIGNHPLWFYSVQAFQKHPDVDQIVLVCRKNEISEYNNKISEYNLSKVTAVVEGGSSRQKSVKNGLAAVNGEYVLIHDGARPLVGQKLISDIICAVKTVGTVLPVVECTDSVYFGERGKTLPRQEILLAQTPQAFHTAEIKQAHQVSSKEYSDDVQLFLSCFQKRPVFITGEATNIKVTKPMDLEYVELLLSKRKDIVD